MKQISVFNEASKNELAQEIKNSNCEVYMCIGTEKVFSDSLGPRVGKLINENMVKPLYVYGMEGSNITAENLANSVEFIRRLHPQKKIAVIDAAVGDREQIGSVQIHDGGIVPGAATNKNLPKVGDVSIIGIVAEKGMADFYTTCREKDELVNKVATFISESIMLANAVN